MSLRKDADQIIRESIRMVLPDETVAKALAGKRCLSCTKEVRRTGRYRSYGHERK